MNQTVEPPPPQRLERDRGLADLGGSEGEVDGSGRRGWGWWPWVGLGVLVLVVVGVGAFQGGERGAGSELPTAPARRGPLTISVSESGAVRPREQMILRNELDDPATIVSIVAEGKQVKKGDLLCELDVTVQRNNLTERRIRVQGAEAALVFAEENAKVARSQAQADVEAAELGLEFAKLDLRKYVEGEYPRLLKDAESKITIAKEELRRAEDVYEWSRRLSDEKYLSRAELERDGLAVKKARLAVELSEADLDLLKRFTHGRQLAALESAVRQSGMALERTRSRVAANLVQAQSDAKSKAALLEEERNKLRELEAEVAKAKLFAPIDGMVLYASSSERWDDDEPPIREGTPVDERGEIIHLPTASAYNVDVKVLEVDLRKVRVGQTARIRVDAMPGRTFTGRVTSIGQLPDAGSRFLNPNLKVYNTVVEIDESDPALRNGMSCRVEAMVEHHADAVHVPVQCVTRVNGRPTVYLAEGGRAVAREVEIGLDNGQFVHVTEGLAGGEPVVLTPPLAADDRDDDAGNGNGGGNGKGGGGGGREGSGPPAAVAPKADGGAVAPKG